MISEHTPYPTTGLPHGYWRKSQLPETYAIPDFFADGSAFVLPGENLNTYPHRALSYAQDVWEESDKSDPRLRPCVTRFEASGVCLPVAVAEVIGVPFDLVYDEMVSREVSWEYQIWEQITPTEGEKRQFPFEPSSRHKKRRSFSQVLLEESPFFGWIFTPVVLGADEVTVAEVRPVVAQGRWLVSSADSKHVAAVVDGVWYDHTPWPSKKMIRTLSSVQLVETAVLVGRTCPICDVDISGLRTGAKVCRNRNCRETVNRRKAKEKRAQEVA